VGRRARGRVLQVPELRRQALTRLPLPYKASSTVEVQWNDLLSGLAILLVVEGLIPFLNPARARRGFEQLVRLADGELRLAGLISMAVGLGLLFLARS
jgi:uncharacterized protein